MAIQSGIIKIEGTIGGLTFYKVGNQYFVKGKSSLTRERVLNDEGFERTRENAGEFGCAAKAGKLVRLALRRYLDGIVDKGLMQRLLKGFLGVVKLDGVSERGQRNVDLGLLNGGLVGFEFNRDFEVGKLVCPHSAIGGELLVVDGVLELDFDLGEKVVSATHVGFQLLRLCAVYDENRCEVVVCDEVFMGRNEVGGVRLEVGNVGEFGDVMWLLRMRCYQEVNGVKYGLCEGGMRVIDN